MRMTDKQTNKKNNQKVINVKIFAYNIYRICVLLYVMHWPDAFKKVYVYVFLCEFFFCMKKDEKLFAFGEFMEVR